VIALRASFPIRSPPSSVGSVRRPMLGAATVPVTDRSRVARCDSPIVAATRS
jgi:hypothetical protein